MGKALGFALALPMLSILAVGSCPQASAQGGAPVTVFENVRIFDGKAHRSPLRHTSSSAAISSNASQPPRSPLTVALIRESSLAAAGR